MFKNVWRVGLLTTFVSSQVHAAPKPPPPTTADFITFNQEYTVDYFDFLKFKTVLISDSFTTKQNVSKPIQISRLSHS